MPLSRDLVARVFPRFRRLDCFYFEFSLAPGDISLPMIGCCNCFGFGIMKLHWKLLYCAWLKTCCVYFAVDGGYGQWGKWSECSVTCGSKKGTRRRDRLCDNPEPVNGGKDCSRLGKDTETEECKPKVSKCPGKYTHLISHVLNERLRKYIVCQIRDTNVVPHSGGQQMASNPWNVSVSKKKSQCVWNKNVIPWKVLEQFLFTRCDASKNERVSTANGCVFDTSHLVTKIVIAHFPWNSLYSLDGLTYSKRWYFASCELRDLLSKHYFTF